MMQVIDNPAITAAVVAMAIFGAGAAIKWLVVGKARQIDGLPAAIQQIQLDLVRFSSRLDRAESELANDKAGRAAFALAQQQLARIDASVIHLTSLMEAQRVDNRDLWSAVNKLRDAA